MVNSGQKMASFEEIREQLISVLKERGDYSPELNFCIEIAAGSHLAYKIALADIQKKRMKSFTKCKTREGHDKLYPHPAFRVLFDAIECDRKNLRELGLTPQSAFNDPNDEVNDIINDVERAGNG